MNRQTVRLATFFAAVVVGLHGAMASAETPIRVAMFKGGGVGTSATQLATAIRSAPDVIAVHQITSEQILRGQLSQFDVLVHPGGSGSGQGKALGDEGRKLVRNFVKTGGGYLGVCAGGYLATNDYTWSLNLIDAKVVDRRHWARGKGTVQLRLSPSGSKFFDLDHEPLDIHYGQGPLFGRREWDRPAVPDYESLACFDSEIATKGAPKGIMVGTSAIVRATYGQGRVFCFSPHPELTEGRDSMLHAAVRWLGKINKGQ